MNDIDESTPSDTRADIARIEAELEQLAASREWCRKVAIGAQAAILGGGLGIGMIFGGAIATTGLSLMVVIILLIGGTVLYGSNGSTAHELDEKIAAAEKARADMIGQIDLRVVSGGPVTLH